MPGSRDDWRSKAPPRAPDRRRAGRRARGDLAGAGLSPGRRVSLWTPPPIGGIVPPARHNSPSARGHRSDADSTGAVPGIWRKSPARMGGRRGGVWHGGRPTPRLLAPGRNRSRPGSPGPTRSGRSLPWGSVEGKGCLPRRRRARRDPAAGGLRGLVLPITIIGAILVFVVPIPPALLDVLLSANLTVAVVVLLTTLSIRAPAGIQRVPDDPADDHADAAGARTWRRRGWCSPGAATTGSTRPAA